MRVKTITKVIHTLIKTKIMHLREVSNTESKSTFWSLSFEGSTVWRLRDDRSAHLLIAKRVNGDRSLELKLPLRSTLFSLSLSIFLDLCLMRLSSSSSSTASCQVKRVLRDNYDAIRCGSNYVSNVWWAFIRDCQMHKSLTSTCVRLTINVHPWTLNFNRVKAVKLLLQDLEEGIVNTFGTHKYPFHARRCGLVEIVSCKHS